MKNCLLSVVLSSLIPVIGFGFVFSGSAVGQDDSQASKASADTVSVQDVEVGQRIRVQLKNGYQLKGNVAAKLTKSIRLDMSKEKQALSGTVSIEHGDVASIDRLESEETTEKTKASGTKQKKTDSKQEKGENGSKKNQGPDQKPPKNKKKEKKQSGDQQSEENEWPPEPSAEQRQLLKLFPEEKWGQKRYQQLDKKYEFQLNSKEKQFLSSWEEIQKARNVKSKYDRHQLLDEFPPEEGWGPEEYRHIKEDLAGLEAKGIPARNPKQRRFLEVFSDWKKAYEEHQEHEKKNEQEKGGEK